MKEIKNSSSRCYNLANNFIHPTKAPNHRNVRLALTIFFSAISLGTLPLFAYLLTKLFCKKGAPQTPAEKKAAAIAQSTLTNGTNGPGGSKTPTLEEKFSQDCKEFFALEKKIKVAQKTGQLPSNITETRLREFLKDELAQNNAAAWALLKGKYSNINLPAEQKSNQLIEIALLIKEIERSSDIQPAQMARAKPFLEMKVQNMYSLILMFALLEKTSDEVEKKRLGAVFAANLCTYIDSNPENKFSATLRPYRSHPGLESFFTDPDTSANTHEFPLALAQNNNHQRAAELGHVPSMIELVQENKDVEKWVDKIIELGSGEDIAIAYNKLDKNIYPNLAQKLLTKGIDPKDPYLKRDLTTYALNLSEDRQSIAEEVLRKTTVKENEDVYNEIGQKLTNKPWLKAILEEGANRGHRSAYRELLKLAVRDNDVEAAQNWAKKYIQVTHPLDLASKVYDPDYQLARSALLEACEAQYDAEVYIYLTRAASQNNEDTEVNRLADVVLQKGNYSDVKQLKGIPTLGSEFSKRLSTSASQAEKKGDMLAVADLLEEAFENDDETEVVRLAEKLAASQRIDLIQSVGSLFIQSPNEDLAKKALEPILKPYLQLNDGHTIYRFVEHLINNDSSCLDLVESKLAEIEDFSTLIESLRCYDNNDRDIPLPLKERVISLAKGKTLEEVNEVVAMIPKLMEDLLSLHMSPDEAYAKWKANSDLYDDQAYAYLRIAVTGGNHDAILEFVQSHLFTFEWALEHESLMTPQAIECVFSKVYLDSSDPDHLRFINTFATKATAGLSPMEVYKKSKQFHHYARLRYVELAANAGDEKAIVVYLRQKTRDEQLQWCLDHPTLVPNRLIEQYLRYIIPTTTDQRQIEFIKTFEDRYTFSKMMDDYEKALSDGDPIKAEQIYQDYIRTLSAREAYMTVTNNFLNHTQMLFAINYAFDKGYYRALKDITDCLYDNSIDEAEEQNLLKFVFDNIHKASPTIQTEIAKGLENQQHITTEKALEYMQNAIARAVELKKPKAILKLMDELLTRDPSQADTYAHQALDGVLRNHERAEIYDKIRNHYQNDLGKTIEWAELQMADMKEDFNTISSDLVKLYHQAGAPYRSKLIAVIQNKEFRLNYNLPYELKDECIDLLDDEAQNKGNKTAAAKLADYYKYSDDTKSKLYTELAKSS